MWLLLGTAVTSVALVLLTRGSWGQLGRLHVIGFWLLGTGLAIQLGLEYVTFSRSGMTTVGYALLMLSYVLILTFCGANFGIRGFGVIAIGIALNALVIGLNVGMPTKPVGDGRGGVRIYKPVTQTVKHRQEQSHDLLTVLDDRILLPRPFDELISFGDLIVAIGICELVFYGSRVSNRTLINRV